MHFDSYIRSQIVFWIGRLSVLAFHMLMSVRIMTGRQIRCQNSVRINVNLVQWRTHESFQWDVLMLPVILSYLSIVVKLVLVKCFDMLYIKQYVWVYEYVYIDFDFISCILCDICMTELFALCVLYFVRDDKIKMFNQKKFRSTFCSKFSWQCIVYWMSRRHHDTSNRFSKYFIYRRTSYIWTPNMREPRHPDVFWQKGIFHYIHTRVSGNWRSRIGTETCVIEWSIHLH